MGETIVLVLGAVVADGAGADVPPEAGAAAKAWLVANAKPSVKIVERISDMGRAFQLGVTKELRRRPGSIPNVFRSPADLCEPPMNEKFRCGSPPLCHKDAIDQTRSSRWRLK